MAGLGPAKNSIGPRDLGIRPLPSGPEPTEGEAVRLAPSAPETFSLSPWMSEMTPFGPFGMPPVTVNVAPSGHGASACGCLS